MNIDSIIELLNEKSTQYKIATETITKNRIGIAKEKTMIETLQKAKAILIQIGEATQNEIKEYIEDTVTLAIQSVFGEDYKFIIEFDYTKREQFEISFYIEHLGIKLEPRKDTCEGGVIDICSFSLRLVCLTLEEPNVAAILILDEPFKNVSIRYIPAVGQMIVDISELLNLQIIMVTHIDGFIETANNIVYL